MKSNKTKKQTPSATKNDASPLAATHIDSQQASQVLANQKNAVAEQPVEENDNEMLDSDQEDQMNDDIQLEGDVQLPKATMYQLIQEKLPEDVRITNASKDLLISLAMCFINALSAKSNVVCGERGKKTIFPEHVLQTMHQSNQTVLLAPIFQKTKAQFGKLSFDKQKDIMFQAINSSAYQQRLQRFKSNHKNNVAPGQEGKSQEELIAEQEAMFQQSKQYEIEYQQNQYQQQQQMQMQHNSSMMSGMAGSIGLQAGQQSYQDNNNCAENGANFQQQFVSQQNQFAPGQQQFGNGNNTNGAAGHDQTMQMEHGFSNDAEGQQQQINQVHVAQPTPEERICELILCTNFTNHLGENSGEQEGEQELPNQTANTNQADLEGQNVGPVNTQNDLDCADTDSVMFEF